MNMATHIESFHPKVLIFDHFNEAITKIDIHTESLLENQIFTKESRQKMNEIREKQIGEIKEIREINLNHLPNEFNEEKYKQKWSHVIDDVTLEYRQKIDKIKEELILVDCVLLENHNLLNGVDLWITSWYYNERNMEFLK